MGSCISKCRHKKKSKMKNEDSDSRVDDKLVISKDPPPAAPEITIIPSDHKPLSPAPSTSSAASFSSFLYSASSKSAVASSISSSSSLSSSSYSYSYSSSSSVLKDRSFSNDFLWSCAKENAHVVGFNQKSVGKTVIFPNKIHSQNLDALTAQEKTLTASSTPKKRARAASPTLVRQKSFRKEQNFAGSTPNRGLRSPSPSRRFNGESNRIFPVKESLYYKKPVVSRGTHAVSSTQKRESFRAPTPSPNRERSRAMASPNRESFRAPKQSPNREMSSSIGECLVRKNDEFSQNISSKIDGREIDDVVMEDINNPLIALDCFIFL